jgi:hypothetical protein
MSINDELGDKRVPPKYIGYRTLRGVPLQTDLEALMNAIFQQSSDTTFAGDGSSEDTHPE